MQKLELFKMIIKDLGVGAKTNVGYGVMQEPKKYVANQPNPQPKGSKKSLKQKEIPSAASLQAFANQMNSYKPKR